MERIEKGVVEQHPYSSTTTVFFTELESSIFYSSHTTRRKFLGSMLVLGSTTRDKGTFSRVLYNSSG